MKFVKSFALICAYLFLCGCVLRLPQTPTATQTIEPTATEEAKPTATPLPAVAVVNGVIIAQEDFDTVYKNEIRALNDVGLSTNDDQSIHKNILEQLIAETLFASGAVQNGISVNDADVAARLAALIEKSGGEETFAHWLAENNYSLAGFRRSLEREMNVATMRQKIFSDALQSIEQVHAYQIRTNTKQGADEARQRLTLGLDFIETAKNYDENTGGDLNWISRGVLYYPELEEALFKIQPGEFTEIIQTEIGYHQLYVAEHSFTHPLSAEVAQILQKKVLAEWIEQQRNVAQITN